jgi:hypothetical protein
MGAQNKKSEKPNSTFMGEIRAFLLVLDSKKSSDCSRRLSNKSQENALSNVLEGGQTDLETYDERTSLLKSDPGKMKSVYLEQESFKPSSRKDVVEGHGDDGLEGQVLLKGMKNDSTQIDVVDHGMRNSLILVCW